MIPNHKKIYFFKNLSSLTWQDEDDRLVGALVLARGRPVQSHLTSVREGEDLPPVLDVADQEAPYEG